MRRVPVAAIAVLLCAAPPAGAAISFTVKTQPAGFSAADVVVADVDGIGGDGRLDAVTAPFSDGVIAFHGDGAGTLFRGTAQGAGAVRRGLQVADMTGDGKADAAVGFPENDNIAFYTGTGDGVFGAPTTINTAPGDYPYDFELGDLTGDGLLDMVTGSCGTPCGGTAMAGSSGLLVLPRASATAPTFSGFTFAEPGSFVAVHIADLDGDGDQDIAGLVENDQVIAWRNNGTGSFTKSGPVAVNGAGRALTSADLDGDGDHELVMPRSDNPYAAVNIVEQGANFTFTFGAFVGVALTAGVGKSITAGDVDGDGRDDLIVGHTAGTGPAGVTVLLNRHAGAGPELVPFPVGGGTAYSSVDTGDLDADGRLDIVSTGPDNNSASLAVLLNRSTALVDTPGEVDVEDVEIGKTGPYRQTVFTNEGHRPVKVEAVTYGSGVEHWSGIVDNCRGHWLRPLESCTVGGRLTPAALGLHTLGVFLYDPDGVQLAIGAISGHGVAAGPLPTGPTGPTGPAGPPGVDGADGANGQDGDDGANGAAGPQGPAGTDGAAGSPGAQGPAGPQGPVGPQGPAGPAGEVKCRAQTVKAGTKRIRITCRLVLDARARAARARLSGGAGRARVTRRGRTVIVRLDRLRPGRYRLALSWTRGGRREGTRTTLTVR